MEVVDHQENSDMGSKEQQQAALIAKGKRTKRQRLHSPIPFAVPTNSSSGELGGFVADHDDHHSDFVPQNNNDHYQNNTNFSPSSSSAHDELLQQFNNNTSTTTEEEEDMANCLILLAQGRPPCSPLTKQLDTGPFPHVTNNVRRFSAENVEKGGGVGCYAYECKTCYRTFPSFQALGGHRASHKKPKAMEAEKKHILSSDDEEIQFKNNNITTTNSLSLQLNQRGSLNNSSGKAKVHECAICGAEFTSGQALGGHMRRHRAMPVGTNTALSLTPMNMETEDQRQPKRQRSVLSLDLDLNLPAPQEHDQRSESKFLIKSNQQQQQQQPQQQQQQQQQQQHNNKQQQQQPLVFPARTLVDCHY
ncbi:zinc finger protein ZAT5-like [Cucumis melo var. makuwa]|nr:zinc finger protein ZAT5-like [Cucumis melo var. makuwa]TYK09241.1 zinc finger protein ZAT5-like [Cucumis melo var. makuwa]